MPSREIVTCQIGPFANWVGAHYWNTQDDARHPASYDESGDPMFDGEQADSAVLYRSSQSQLTPRLIVCDAADAFGNLGLAGGVAVPVRNASSTTIDPLSWGGSVAQVEQEAHAVHAFAQMMRAPILQGAAQAGHEEAYDIADEDEDEDDEDDEDGNGRRRSAPAGKGVHDPRMAGPQAASRQPLGAEEEEEDVKAASFEFETSVKYWSDYLQAHLHSRSVAPLKPHTHGFSTLARFPDGQCIVEREEDCADGAGLVERVRRFLEECDALQGFHFLLDADSGFGGTACALLTQIRDDYSRAPCLALGLGTLNRPKSSGATASSTAATEQSAVASVGGDHGGLGAHSYVPALNDALSLTAFAELNASYVPLYGSAGLRAVLDAAPTADNYGGTAPVEPPLASAPPLLEPRSDLRYHTAAPLAAWLDVTTLSYRARSPAGDLNGLVRTLTPRGGMHVSTALLGLPMPSDAELLLRQGWMAPLLPLQQSPFECRAYEQHISWLGHAGGGRSLVPLLPSLLPCRSDGGSLWVRPQPWALPLSFPQFFSRAVGVQGEVGGAPSDAVGRTFTPELARAPPGTAREDTAEVMRVAVAGALQCSPALLPSVRRITSNWAVERRAAERAGVAEGWAQRDELAEVSEQLIAIREAYSEEQHNPDDE